MKKPKFRPKADTTRIFDLLKEVGRLDKAPASEEIPRENSPRDIGPTEPEVAHYKDRVTACGKQGFDTPGQADKAAKNRLRKGANCGRFRSYFCSFCKKYHLTSAVKNEYGHKRKHDKKGNRGK